MNIKIRRALNVRSCQDPNKCQLTSSKLVDQPQQKPVGQTYSASMAVWREVDDWQTTDVCDAISETDR